METVRRIATWAIRWRKNHSLCKNICTPFLESSHDSSNYSASIRKQTTMVPIIWVKTFFKREHLTIWNYKFVRRCRTTWMAILRKQDSYLIKHFLVPYEVQVRGHEESQKRDCLKWRTPNHSSGLYYPESLTKWKKHVYFLNNVSTQWVFFME